VDPLIAGVGPVCLVAR